MYSIVRPILFMLDAERAHRLGTGAARLAQAAAIPAVHALFDFKHESLRQNLWGLDFPNPVGLAAGFDKNAHLVPFWEAIGFGFAEVGSVSAQPVEGNPRPRAFRLPPGRALVNRMGLNNDGAETVAERLEGADATAKTPLGINLAKTHDPSITGDAAVEDFRQSFRRLAPLASYIALNISCPNTSEGKTFESPSALETLLDAVMRERELLKADAPVLLKLSPPLSDRVAYDSDLQSVIRLARDYAVAGFIAANTASDRVGLATDAGTLASAGPGGLSGPPIARRTTRMIRHLYESTNGELPIIGAGGIDSPEAAYEKIRAGASLVQFYTGLVYEGPGLVNNIKTGLVRLLDRDGFSSVEEAVGADHRQNSSPRFL